MSCEEFGFVNGKKVHDAFEIASESLHLKKYKKLQAFALKINLYKSFDRQLT